MNEEQGGKQENTQGGSIPPVQVEGTGHVEHIEKPQETQNEGSGAVEYSAGAEASPMDDLAAEGDQPAEQAPVKTKAPSEFQGELENNNTDQGPKDPDYKGPVKEDKSPPAGGIDEAKVRENPELSTSDKDPFDPGEVQSALKNSKDEGGIVKTKTTGPTQSPGKPSDEGELLKPAPDTNKDSLVGKYEVTGFDVEYKVGDVLRSVHVRDYFNELDTAFASVNGDRYLMPMPGGGYKVSVIRMGAPSISFNERQLYYLKDGGWERT